MKFISWLFLPFLLIAVYKLAATVFPGKPIEYTIITVLLSATGWLARMYFLAKAEEGSLRAQVKTTETDNSKLRKKIDDLEAENKDLKEQVASSTNKDSILSRYIFLHNFGIYKHRTSGTYFCPTCLLEHSRESPLKDETQGWRCPCNHYFSNPNYTPPPQPPYDPFA